MLLNKQKHQFKNPLFRILVVVSIISFLITSFFIYKYIKYKSDVTYETREGASSEAKRAARSFHKTFDKLIKITDSIAEELVAYEELRKDEIIGRLDEIIKRKNLDLYGIGVVYIPYIDDPDIRKKSPYYLCKEESKNNVDRSKILQLYSAPIYKIDTLTNIRIRTGIVFVDYLISDIKEIVGDLDLGKSGYGYILSRNGTFIAHPVNEYNELEKTIFKVAEEKEDRTLLKIGEAIIRGESGIVEHSNELTGQLSWIFYEPIKSINWAFVVVYIKEDILDLGLMKTQLAWSSMFLLILLSSLSVIFTRSYLGGKVELGFTSGIFSLLLIFEIAFIWYLVLNFNTQKDTNVLKIVDKTGLDNYVNVYSKKTFNRCKVKPHKIPTGVSIEAMEFPTATNVFLSGYVWQKYYDGIHDNVERGIFFPDALSKKEEIIGSYVSQEDGYTLYGWYFRVTIKHTFDYSKYPLDFKDLYLRILPKDFAKNIILIPDLDAYKYINPSLKPGISAKTTVLGWEIKKSNFVYKVTTYNTSFGMHDFTCREKTPDLYFNINFTRNFVGTIFSKLMPLIVMLTILFILIVIGTNNLDNVSRILGPVGAFFFAVILSHVSLRDELIIKDIVYFEYFYITMYLMILLIFINSVFYSRKQLFRLVAYKDNLISKLLFWPLFYFILFAISVVLLLL